MAIIERSFSENFDLGDGDTRQNNACSLYILHSFLMGDASGMALNQHHGIGDSISINDQIDRTFLGTFARSVMSSMALNDLNTQSLELTKQLASNTELNDSIDQYLSISRSLSNNFTFNDLLSRTVEGFVVYERFILEAFGFSDALSRGIFRGFVRTISDSIDYTDLQERYLLLSRKTDSSIDLTDNIIQEIGLEPLFRSLTDSLSFAETQTAQRMISRSLVDYAATVDSLTRFLLAVRQLVSNITLSDLVSSQLISGAFLFSRVVASSVDISENINQAIAYSRLCNQVVYFVDLLATNLGDERRLRSTIDIDDTIVQTLILTLIRDLADNVNLDDAFVKEFISILKKIGYIRHSVESLYIIMEIESTRIN